MQSAAPPPGSQGANRLGLLYQHILTGVVRIQSGKQKIADIETLRRRMKGALEQAERESDYRLSPPIQITTAAPAPSVPKAAHPWYLWAGGILLAVLVLFVVYSLDLGSRVSELRALTGPGSAGL